MIDGVSVSAMGYKIENHSISPMNPEGEAKPDGGMVQCMSGEAAR